MSPAARYVTLGRAATQLGVSYDTLRQWVAQGRFPGYRTLGGRYRIAVADIEAGLHLEPAARHPRGDRGGSPDAEAAGAAS